MKNRYEIGELVLVNGKGKISQKQTKALAIIEYKEYELNQYFVTLISSHVQDWFSEKDIYRVLDKKSNKSNKYKVVLAIEKRGLDYIANKIERENTGHNNILRKTDFYREYKINKKVYSILIWQSTYWAKNNTSIKCIEESFSELQKNNIAYKRIIIGETDQTYIKINEFTQNDDNVDIFNIVQKIEIEKLGGILVW